ncbi:MAG: hypothetical protein R3F19_05185 [Verrucomicrobiales bacterium]
MKTTEALGRVTTIVMVFSLASCSPVGPPVKLNKAPTSTNRSMDGSRFVTESFAARSMEGLALPAQSLNPPSDDPFSRAQPSQRVEIVTGESDPEIILSAAGIQFPEGAFARYSRETGTLTVRNRPDQLKLVRLFLQE